MFNTWTLHLHLQVFQVFQVFGKECDPVTYKSETFYEAKLVWNRQQDCLTETDSRVDNLKAYYSISIKFNKSTGPTHMSTGCPMILAQSVHVSYNSWSGKNDRDTLYFLEEHVTPHIPFCTEPKSFLCPNLKDEFHVSLYLCSVLQIYWYIY